MENIVDAFDAIKLPSNCLRVRYDIKKASSDNALNVFRKRDSFNRDNLGIKLRPCIWIGSK
jgi:hypothetical protein